MKAHETRTGVPQRFALCADLLLEVGLEAVAQLARLDGGVVKVRTHVIEYVFDVRDKLGHTRVLARQQTLLRRRRISSRWRY